MKKCVEYDARTEKKLIFAQVLKVVGLNQGIQTHLMKHYLQDRLFQSDFDRLTIGNDIFVLPQ